MQADVLEAAHARGAEASSSSAREAALREEVQRLKAAGRQHMDEAERLAQRAEQLADANRQFKVQSDRASVHGVGRGGEVLQRRRWFEHGRTAAGKARGSLWDCMLKQVQRAKQG